MTTTLTRRDFLKLAALLPAQAWLSQHDHLPLLQALNFQKKNVLIIVFDTWSAKHLSLFGYRRQTTAQLEDLAEKAIVYHQHYAAAPWTVPSTASLLSGQFPWSHRVFNTSNFQKSTNMFGMFEEAGYFIQSYTHNPLAYRILKKYASPHQINLHPDTFYIAQDPTFNRVLERDQDAYRLARHQIFLDEDEVNNSLYLTHPMRALLDGYFRRVLAPYKDMYPSEPPYIAGSQNYYILQDPFEWLVETLPLNPQPYLHYYHFYPPHAPYRPRTGFDELFNDGWDADDKAFAFPGPEPQRKANRNRREYDCFVTDVDSAFADLYRGLEQSGALKDTWLVLTSDHGEMFERGFIGHINITLFDPLVRVPLVIFPPQPSGRIDIEDRTSALDVLPTLLQLTGQPTPTDLPGRVLPPFDPDNEGMSRRIFTMNPRHSSPTHQLREGTIGLLQDEYKLVYYFGHEEMGDVSEHIELYDMVNDPEELTDLYPRRPDVADPMLAYLREQLEQANNPYPLPE